MVMSWWATLLLIAYTLVGVVIAWVWYPLMWRFFRSVNPPPLRRWVALFYAIGAGFVWPILAVIVGFDEAMAWRIRLDERSRR